MSKAIEESHWLHSFRLFGGLRLNAVETQHLRDIEEILLKQQTEIGRMTILCQPQVKPEDA